MSDYYIPLDIEAEILKRLPVKPLIQFRSVSKSWKSLIDSSEFINDHRIHKKQTQPPHIYLDYKENTDWIAVSLVDDDTFPNSKFSHTIPESINQLEHAFVDGSSHGVLCVYGDHRDLGLSMVVLWNPTVRKSVGIVVPNKLSPPTGSTFVSFGVSGATNDPKLVKINIINMPCIHWEVELFTLSSKAWKSLSINPPFELCKLRPVNHVLIEGFAFWYCYGEENKDDKKGKHPMIIYFYFKREEIGELCLPDSIKHPRSLSLSKLNESLVVVDSYEDDKDHIYGVCMMKDGVTQLFTKMFTIKLPPDCGRLIRGFRKNAEVIMEGTEDDDHHHDPLEVSILEVYDPCSGHINAIGFKGSFDTFFLTSYTETLLLLN